MFILQDVFILLDLIGTAEVSFTNFFPATEKLYERLQKIGRLFFNRIFKSDRIIWPLSSVPYQAIIAVCA